MTKGGRDALNEGRKEEIAELGKGERGKFGCVYCTSERARGGWTFGMIGMDGWVDGLILVVVVVVVRGFGVVVWGLVVTLNTLVNLLCIPQI